ncbi:MAG: enoyl-CoA hydratase/isomerase family protein [Candidatus Hatepunaea meridiana]|nr:enoyl-CoA hydratase/isomerase family protein [Candidatus Hatepunaea meridiana]
MNNLKLTKTKIENCVGYITMNRPGLLNAFCLNMARELLEVLDDFKNNSEVRSIVILGEGKVFSSGGDVKEMLGYVEDGKDPAAYFRAPLSSFGKICETIRDLPKPVIAAVHGAAMGFAFNLVLSCDFKIATENARFGQAFIRLGLSPDGGGTWMLPKLVGYSRACQLTMLPDEIDAKTALDWGLINWIVSLDEFELKYKQIAEKLTKGPSNALARTKLLLNQSFNNTISVHTEYERLAQIENAHHFNFGEGLKAFTDKREPEFE